jgi:hypothetical protein
MGENGEHSDDFPFRIDKARRHTSLPNLEEKTLAEELEFNFDTLKTLRHKTTDTIRERYIGTQLNEVRIRPFERWASSSIDIFHCSH